MTGEKLINLDVMQIQEYQQNRFPCLFVDCITEVVPGDYAYGYKNFTYNEWFFPAHFPDEPNVPGFIQIEALTQVFLMTFLTLPGYKGMKTGFIDVHHHFWKKIVPGTRLTVKAKLHSFRRGIAKGKAIGLLDDGTTACESELTIVIPEVLDKFRPADTK